MMLAMVTIPCAIAVMRAETFPNAVIGAPLCCGAQRAAARDGSPSNAAPHARSPVRVRARRSAVVFLVALRELTRPVRVLLDRRQGRVQGRIGAPHDVGHGLPPLVRFDGEAL